MKIKSILSICSLATAIGLIIMAFTTEPTSEITIPQEKWISIFNGKNLDGWTPKFTGHKLGINYKNTFHVEDGLLKVSYDNYKSFDGKFGHLFYKQPYSNYKIRLEYRFVGQQVPGAPDWAYRNSGIKFHCQPPESMAKDQQSPVSIEVQLLGGNGKEPRPTANICSMGTHIVMNDSLVTQHCTQSTSKTYHGDQWVEVEAEVHGSDIITHYVNGQKVLSYSDPQYDTSDSNTQKLIGDSENLIITEGYIALQAESHPVHFRNIEILPL
ncbi:3-keto-disaccharide hydrolase [Fodinibius salsisoli]|uniref:DUF1080 domain-containing protein n=1 Tax=Fodinibius salsisoli TaxID=2820877 RepID=A0ABT3PKP0_9BACT|nr:DUF1080 domain-containing protein [Fodinibius salsisoli]MCW9706496.1 DUF1080 domain-containing protein [Fodinibius salsisoli]